MLTGFTVVIISQYIQISDHYVVHLKHLIRVNYILIFRKERKLGVVRLKTKKKTKEIILTKVWVLCPSRWSNEDSMHWVAVLRMLTKVRVPGVFSL